MPAIFASGAQLTDVVFAATPGSGLPPSPSAPESPVADDAASAPEPSTDTEPQAELPQEGGEQPEGEEPEAEEQLMLPPTNRGQRRFVSNLIRENERAKAELEALRQQQSVLIQRLQSPPVPEPPLPPPGPLLPRREDYQDEAGYIAAMVNHELVRREAFHAAQQQSVVWQQRMAQGAESFSDFDAVINNPAANPAPAIQPVLYEAVCDSEDGAALLYALGKDLALLRRLNTMTPLAAAREVGRLEATLKAQRQAPPPPRSPARSPAPAPPRPIQQPVSGGGAPSPVGGFRPGMSMREYEAMRRQERGRR